MAEALAQHRERGGIREALRAVQDLERLRARLAMGHGNARDLLALRESFQALPALEGWLAENPGRDVRYYACGRRGYLYLQKRGRRIEECLDSPEFAEHWSRTYEALLLSGASMRRDGRSMIWS